MWAVVPPLWKDREKGAQLLHHVGGGTGERRRRRRQRSEQQQTANERLKSVVRGSCVAANQQIRNCKWVPLRQSAWPAARPNSIGPPLESRCFPSILVDSRRFSSILFVSPAFRLEFASYAGSSPPQSCKETPIQEEWPSRLPPRHECGARRATLKTYQVAI